MPKDEEEEAMEDILEDEDEDDDDDDDIQTSMTPSAHKRYSTVSTTSSFKRSTESELGSKTSLRSSRVSSANSYNIRSKVLHILT